MFLGKCFLRWLTMSAGLCGSCASLARKSLRTIKAKRDIARIHVSGDFCLAKHGKHTARRQGGGLHKSRQRPRTQSASCLSIVVTRGSPLTYFLFDLCAPSAPPTALHLMCFLNRGESRTTEGLKSMEVVIKSCALP